MSGPVRVQLSRKAGWRMPPNTVSVARPGKWGNPFPIGREGPFERVAPDAEGAVGFFRSLFLDAEMLFAANYPFRREVIAELRGKNLACWCALGQPCHADVLLEVANAEASA
jgi:hypothetical protein